MISWAALEMIVNDVIPRQNDPHHAR